MVVWTDNVTLKYFATQPKLSSKQVRWQDTLALFNVDIRHKPGKENIVPDALSRKHQLRVVLGQATGTWTHKIHHGLDSGEATTFPYIVYFVALHGGYIQMALFPGTPKLESRNWPKIVPVGVPGLWELITLECRV